MLAETEAEGSVGLAREHAKGEGWTVELVRRRHPVLLLLPSLLSNVLAAAARTDPAVRTASGPRPPRAQALSLRLAAIDATAAARTDCTPRILL